MSFEILKSNIQRGNPSLPPESGRKTATKLARKTVSSQFTVAPPVIYISKANSGGDMKEMQFEKRNIYTNDHFVMDDVYIDHYAKVCGVYATCVYMGPCRYADRITQSCSPRISLLADKLNISTRQVFRVLKILEYYNIIKIERTPGEVNKYLLIDSKYWKPLGTCQKPVTKGDRCQRDTGTSVSQTVAYASQTPPL